MAKKYTTFSSIINKAKDEISSQFTSKHKIPDIITFCYDPEYLNFSGQNIKLKPFQQIMLKVMYRGSVGNENIKLTDEEIELCKKNGLDCVDNGNVIGKYNSGEIFRELVLVWGRRSGKDFKISIIAAYEAMKLIECEGGDPYAIYGISNANPISILTVANSKDQSETAFKEIKHKILDSKYFMDKIGPDGIETQRIFLLTPKDRLENERFLSKGFPLKKGSIVVEVGHSNSDTLRGKQVFILILDEVAMYKQTGGSSSGEQIYTALSPTLNTFKKRITTIDTDGNIIKNENGEDVYTMVYDSKIISISSPRGEEGIFYRLFIEADKVKERLACRLPTWIVDPDNSEERLRETNSHLTEEQFLMEFGAEFSGTGGESFFPRQKVEDCFTPGFNFKECGKPGEIYFAHLDPATSSHNYAIVILHKKMFMNQQTKQNDFYIEVDHIKYWHPLPDKPIDIDVVDDYIMGLKRMFYLGMVTYDQWNSDRSIKRLKQNGIPAKMTRFTRRYKMIIYDELYNLIIAGRLKIPIHTLLRGEMLNIQRKYMPPAGYKVYPKRDGDVYTDDILDALAGACYSAMQVSSVKLPYGKLINTGVTPTSNSRMWQSMSGPMGFGTGGQVANRLEKRNFR
jgi:hypothetical protein